MKPIVLLMLVLFCSFVTYGQKYVPFPTENVEWNVMFSSYSEGTGHNSIYVSTYSLQGDSILDGKVYKKLVQNMGTTEFPSFVDVGLLREEDKRVYYRREGFFGPMYAAYPQQIKKIKDCLHAEKEQIDGEILLYDFNLKVGDHVKLGYYDCFIEKVDSVLIDHSYRKRYYTGYDIIVEGIGSIQKGLLGSMMQIPTCGGGMSWEFVCFSQDGKTVYKNPDYKDCNSTQKWSDSNPLMTNTQWYYGQIDYPFYTSTIKNDNYNSLKSIGDTTILGLKYNILSQVKGDAGCASFESPAYVFQNYKTVYIYNSKTTHFSTLYMYDANKGDSWTVSYPMGDVNVKVDSVSAIEALGHTLNVQHVTYSTVAVANNGYSEKSTIIENVGDVNYFFQSSLFQRSDWVCDEFGVVRTGLRCYVHPDYGTYHVPGTLDCSYVTGIKNPPYMPVNVYINSTNNLIIESESLTEPCTFELMDIRGCLILRTQVSTNQNSVHLSQLNKGIYMYRLTNDGKLLKTGKLVKM